MGSALTLGAGSGPLLDAPLASGAFVTEWTEERATGAGARAVAPGSWSQAAANTVAAPASARTTPMIVIRLASLPNLMASPRNSGQHLGLPQDPSQHGKRVRRPSDGSPRMGARWTGAGPPRSQRPAVAQEPRPQPVTAKFVTLCSWRPARSTVFAREWDSPHAQGTPPVKGPGNLHSPGAQLLPTQAGPGCQSEVVPEACLMSFRVALAAFLLLALTDCWGGGSDAPGASPRQFLG